MLSSKQRKTTIDYLYDFSDSWEHSLVVTGGTPVTRRFPIPL
jgi:hypothetical protein